EAAFVLELLAAAARLLLVDGAGREFRVDRHLLARHGVEVEARGDFGDAPRALGDDDEVHDHQDDEDDNADDEVAAHHEVAEGLDDVAGGVGMNSAVIRISTDRMIEMARAKSSSSGGSGRIRTTRIVSTPMASAMSPRLKKAPISPRPGSFMPPAGAAGAAVMSLMKAPSA